MKNNKKITKLKKYKNNFMLKQLATTNKLLKPKLFSSSSLRSFSTYLIKNGTIVNPDRQFKGDVVIEGDKITGVFNPADNIASQRNFDRVFDAAGKMVIPGGIDPHVHMELPFMGTTAIDDFDIGSKAAVAGGTTCYIDFIIPGEEGLIHAYKDWRARADKKTHCDYALHCAITHWNPEVAKEMEEIVKQGVSSFKLFTAYKGTTFYQTDERMLQIFERVKQVGGTVLVHAENAEIISYNQNRLINQGVTGPEGHALSRPDEVEAEATHRVITLASAVNVPLYVVHVMKKGANDEIVKAKRNGNVVFAEALAAGLGVDGRHYWNPDWDHAAGYVMSPAIDCDPATKEYQMRLIHTHDIDTTATDNCAFCTSQKRMGKDNFTKIPNGCNGVEDRMSVIWSKGVNTGMITPSDFVRATSTQTAKIFNMYPRKGIIQTGADADVVIWDPNAEKTISKETHHHAGDFNIFEGMKVKGLAQTTFSAGRLVYNEGIITSTPGSGRFITRENYGFAYERVHLRDLQRKIRETPVDRSGAKKEAPEETITKLQTKLDISQEKIKKLERELEEAKKNGPTSGSTGGNASAPLWQSGELTSVEEALTAHLPEKEAAEVNRILNGRKAEKIELSKEAHAIAQKLDFDLVGYKIAGVKEELRPPRNVRIGAVQHSIKTPTDAPVAHSLQVIHDWAREVVKAAHLSGVNVIGFQELWNAPFFLCTREKMPWIQYAEDYENGPTAQLFKELSAKYNMVIVSPILERCTVKETIWNSAVVFYNGKVLGRHHKNHIPRVGDFNESTYYMEGQLGHPVFETPFGRIGINICYGRHHPLNWISLGLNGAEIVFNPSATVGGLSEPMWPIEARCAAIANHYFSVAINRVGTETYPNPFTSGDGKAPKTKFGHFYGSSYIAAPDASRTPGLSRTRDGLLVAEVDLNLCRQVKDVWGFSMTNRLEMYAELFSKASKDGYKPQRVKPAF